MGENRALVERIGGGTMPCRVLVLGGWSPGPLGHIKHRFRNECRFFEPALHMPPQGCLWLRTWQAALLLSWLVLVIVPLLVQYYWLFALHILLSLFVVPRLIGLLVRGSIRRCVDIAVTEVARNRIDVILAFSWGAGIACWLLHQREWGGPTLLLAPALKAMASAARRPLKVKPFFQGQVHAPAPPHSGTGSGGGSTVGADNALEGENNGPRGSLPTTTAAIATGTAIAPPPHVHIFHPLNDPFCPPAQIADLEETSAEMHTCGGGHVFADTRALADIERVLAEMIATVQTGEQDDDTEDD